MLDDVRSHDAAVTGPAFRSGPRCARQGIGEYEDEVGAGLDHGAILPVGQRWLKIG